MRLRNGRKEVTRRPMRRRNGGHGRGTAGEPADRPKGGNKTADEAAERWTRPQKRRSQDGR
jgi:hypothetical protein